MPPKGKATAKAKGKAAAAPPDVPLLEVPPAPVCVPLPDSCQPRCATERCLLFASEAKSTYKVQARPWSPGDTAEKAASADDWRDAKELERISMPPGYEEGRLFAFEQSRIQYRMVLLAGPKADGLYVANLQSAASDPICTFLDPPLHLRAELRCDSDVVPAVVTLSWRLPNMEWLRPVQAQGPQGSDMTWAAGLMPSKVQVRWRVLQSLPNNNEALPAELASGNYVTAPEAAMDADFRMDETWQCTYKEALPAAIAVFSVRLGTTYKWSPWSEDSPALSVEVPEPCPRVSGPAESEGRARDRDPDRDPYVEISDLTDSQAQALWRPFATEGALRALEYRVSICQLESPESTSPWEDAVVGGILHVQEPPEKVRFPLRGLRPDQWYQVRVDARYPCVGKRAFSDSKAVSAAFRTPLPLRPPLQPLPLRLDLDEEQPEEEEAGAGAFEPGTAFLWAARPWVSVCVEHFASETYKFQFKEAVLKGRSDFDGWQEPLVVEAAQPSHAEAGHAIVRIGLPKGAPELVALRLADTASSSPLRWSVTSPPIVTRVAPPLLACCFPGGAMQLLPTVGGGLQLHLRFFLQPGMAAPTEALPLPGPALPGTTAAGASVRRSLPGHRYVSQCQLRLRVKAPASKGKSNGGFLELPARALPQAQTCLSTPGLQALATDGEVPDSPEEELIAGLLGWRGVRYEFQADLAEASLRELVTGPELLEASLRVGTEHRWSPWSPWSPPQALPLPLPRPPRSGKVGAEATGPTSVRVSWPPFDRLPGISCLEYAVRCEPLAEASASASSSSRVESVCFLHKPRRLDAQVLASAQFQRLLDQPEMSLARLASCFQDIRLAEAEDEKDLLQVEVTGLLPWTSYGLSVAARYPAGAGLYPHSQTEGRRMSEALGPLLGPALTVQVETPGGENAPGAPQEVDPAILSCEASSFLTPGLRGIFLSIEDRSDYALEYCASGPAWAHYDAEVGAAALRSFQGSWPRLREEGVWKRVSTVHRLQEIPSAAGELKEASATSPAPSKVIVLAVMPAFGQPGPMPDAVRFRLCAVDRGAAHPCRWAGGVSEAFAVAFAPPRRPPRIQRILSDDRWTLSLQIELFQNQPPPTPTCYLGLRTGTEDTEDDSECEEEEAKELVELRRAQLLPTLRPESWQETALEAIPWGYGHRLVTMVQARCSLQSSLLPEHRMDLEREVLSSEWQLSAALELGAGGAATFEASSCELVQASVRVGDGFRWSPWKACKEVPVLLEKPRAPEGAEALASWKKVCRVEWPLAIAHAGIQEVEYQLLVIPDSAHLLPFVGALVVAPAASEAPPMSPRGPGGRKKGRKEGAGTDKTSAGAGAAYPPSTDSKNSAGAPSMAYLVAGQATLRSRREGEGEDGAPVVLELAELCPELRYAFQVFARYPTVGPRIFHKIYEVGKISRGTPEAAVALPLPVQVPCSEESQETMQRWLQDDRPLVLLTWDGLLPEAANPRQASLVSTGESLNPPFEVQAAAADAEDAAEAAEEAEAAGERRSRQWFHCPVVTKPFALVASKGVSSASACVAVRDLPFRAGWFRLFDPSRMQAGPCTRPIVCLYEQLEPCKAEMLALPRSAGSIPRSLGILLQISFAGASGSTRWTARLAGLLQLRFRRIGCVGEAACWEELPAEATFQEGPKVVREEDGLELGNVYEFQVRVGDQCRMGPWSKSSPPVRFALSPPVPSEGGGLRILEKGDRAEVSWAPFQPDAASQAQLPNLARLPIEYTLSVFAEGEGEGSGPSGSAPSLLLSSQSLSETRCLVANLRPLSAYSASLTARWSRFGVAGDSNSARLFAAFATTGPKGSKLTAELSVRLSGQQTSPTSPSAAPAPPASRASIPVVEGVPAAVTLDLDPYYTQPRLNHYTPEFVRKPSLPSSRRTQAQAQDLPEERPLSPKLQPTLPRVLVPMPPPKSTTRDPLSFALLQPKPPAPRSARGTGATSSAFRDERER